MTDEKQQSQERTPAAPPYIAYKTFKGFLSSLKVAIPSRIDRSVMTTYSGAVQNQITHAMRFFNLIDMSGHPSDKLAPLVHSEGAEHQRLIKELVQAGYPMLFNSATFDLKKATSAQLSEQFSKVATGDTLRKCITFLLPMMKEAGIEISPHIKGAPKRNGTARAKKPKAAPAPAQEAGAGSPPPPPPAPPVMGWSELLLSKFPSFDPSWPDDVKSRWFESFEKLMQSGQTPKTGG